MRYWLEAGRRAAGRSADREAVSHLRSGLRALAGLPASIERDRAELDFQLAIGTPLIALSAWSDPAVAAAYERAGEICESLGETGVSASRGPFRFFWTTECEAAHAIRFGHFSLPGNDIGQALRGNDGEEKRDGTDNSRAAGRLPRETRDGRQRWQWGATAEHLGDH
jgi:hypothetical protein